jgi:2-dehydro-3-deoxyphosphogluconate aldolase/(4S)-4-hydroxy-2-oxoglutarate aldolase
MTVLKLFPASVVGGVSALKAFGAPLADLRFCPTGGIGEPDFLEYLALSNVLAVGGSWVAPAKSVRDADWAGIEALARAARAKAEAAGWQAG